MVAVRSDSQLILLGRVFWMMAGPAMLLLCTILILSPPGTGWHTAADIVYWIALAGMIGGRWLEYQGGNPRTGTGEPATPAHLWRYMLAVALIGPAVWVVANVVSNYLLV
jgi:hypothetical protein